MPISKAVTRIYYFIKPLVPRRLQLWLRRQFILGKRSQYADVWPILEKAGQPAHGWTGWPDHKQFALVLTHDVDTARGQQRCQRLMELEEQLGFRSAFNFVPERYPVSAELREDLVRRGFEVGVHGLNHDGKLYASRKIFMDRAVKINRYLRDWNAVGFRSPAMHHNLDWIRDLHIEYDASTFDTDPFEPQPDGVETIFPFWVNGNSFKGGYVELPYTLSQDFTLFVLMQEKSIEIWQKKLDWIVAKGGMALLNTHPDYMSFSAGRLGLEEYPIEYYRRILEYVKSKFHGRYWHALPRDIARFFASHKNCGLVTRRKAS
jgi:peptidoglycan/xylan/chitin deacetylase (PgdA/CDA1 family)